MRAYCIVCEEKCPRGLSPAEQDAWLAHHKKVGCSKLRLAARDAALARDDDSHVNPERTEARRLFEGLSEMFGEDDRDDCE